MKKIEVKKIDVKKRLLLMQIICLWQKENLRKDVLEKMYTPENFKHSRQEMNNHIKNGALL